MKIEFDLIGFCGTRVGVYHPFGMAWGRLSENDGVFQVRTEIDFDVPCELQPITEFREADIDTKGTAVKMGTLYIHLVHGRFVTSALGGLSWKCDDGPHAGELCVYDTKHDVALDNCIYCGQPFERK